MGCYHYMLISAQRGEESAADRAGGFAAQLFHFVKPPVTCEHPEIRDTPVIRILDDGFPAPAASRVGPTVVAEKDGMRCQRHRPGILKMVKICGGVAESGNMMIGA